MKIPEEWLNRSKHKVNEIFEEVRNYCSLKAPLPIKSMIETYMEDVNYVVSMDYEFPEGVSAFSQKDMDIGWLIVINGKEIVERQRFSAAHEFGHITLLTNQAKKVFCSKDSDSWDEKLCDRFAGDILMPEIMIRELYKSTPSPYLEDIAKIFKVSRPVAEIQLRRLQLPFKKRY